MGKNQSASNLTNIIQYNNGNIVFVSGSTTLMQISSSGAITTTGVISGSNALSASYAVTASFVTTAQTASFVANAQTASFVANAQSASNAVNAQTASSADNFLTRGTLTAQTLVVQTITSSVSTITGSTNFGSTGSNTHRFTGSVLVTGSIKVADNPGVDYIGFGASGTAAKYSYITSTFEGAQRVGLAVYTTQDAGVSNQERVRINDSGSVGIGISSPTARLHVSGTTGGLFEVDGAAAVNALYVSSSGNIGIGTTNPNTKTHIQESNTRILIGELTSGNSYGAITMFTSMNGTGYSLTSNGFNTYLNASSSGELGLRIDNSSKLTISSSGNIGINTSAPVRLLEVYGSSLSADTPNIRISSADTSGTNKFGIEFYSRTGADVRGRVMADNNGKLYLDSVGGGGVILNAAGGSGNVGIGITNPSSKLSLYMSDTADNVQLRIQQAARQYWDFITTQNEALYLKPQKSTSTEFPLFIIQNAGGTTQFSVNTYTSASFFNGNVGIGTTNPTSNLQIQNTSANEVRSFTTSTSSYANFIADTDNSINYRLQMVGFATAAAGTLVGINRAGNGFVVKSGGLLGIGTRDANDLVFGTNETERMRISGSGNVGIGTSAPSFATLQVNGTFFQATNKVNNYSTSATTGSGGTIIFPVGSASGYGYLIDDNVNGLIIISINEPNSNTNNNSAVYIGNIVKPRGSNPTVTQISKVLGGGITALTVTNSGNDISSTATSSTATTLRTTLIFIGAGGMS